MTKNADSKLDHALDRLAQDVIAASPRPGPDLMARVLADAAAIHPPQVEVQPGMVPERNFRVTDLLFGWASGAVAAIALALVIGMGVGMQMEAGDLPFLEEEAVALADGGLLPEEIL